MDIQESEGEDGGKGNRLYQTNEVEKAARKGRFSFGKGGRKNLLRPKYIFLVNVVYS